MATLQLCLTRECPPLRGAKNGSRAAVSPLTEESARRFLSLHKRRARDDPGLGGRRGGSQLLCDAGLSEAVDRATKARSHEHEPLRRLGPGLAGRQPSCASFRGQVE